MWPHINAYSLHIVHLTVGDYPSHDAWSVPTPLPTPLVPTLLPTQYLSLLFLLNIHNGHSSTCSHYHPFPTVISQLPIHCPPSLPTLILLLTMTHHYLLSHTPPLYSLLLNTTLHSLPSVHHHCLLFYLLTTMIISNSSLYYQPVPIPHCHHSPFVFLHLTFTAHSLLHSPQYE